MQRQGAAAAQIRLHPIRRTVPEPGVDLVRLHEERGQERLLRLHAEEAALFRQQPAQEEHRENSMRNDASLPEIPVGCQYCIRICVDQAAAHSHSCQRPTKTGRATIPRTRARPEWAGGSLSAPRPVSGKPANVCGGPQTAACRRAAPGRDPLPGTQKGAGSSPASPTRTTSKSAFHTLTSTLLDAIAIMLSCVFTGVQHGIRMAMGQARPR